MCPSSARRDPTRRDRVAFDLTASVPACQCRGEVIRGVIRNAGVGASEPFDFVGDGEVGVVCVHGFTGSPYEMRYLGEQLARAGHTVAGPRLPGHGTSVDELDRTGWEDWAAAVEREAEAMSARCRRVVVVG
ncbi:MAG: alpha/beta fold hydrolase, partial [Myxococcales bacterium]|nr:alpha/beta fold hydrolase [Myxococcales bacterium]